MYDKQDSCITQLNQFLCTNSSAR